MSRRSRALKNTRAELNGRGQRVTKLSGPGDALAMIPFVLGFTPRESLVMVVLEGPRRRFGPFLRLDLVAGQEGRDEADYAVALIRRHRFRSVMLFAFSETREPATSVLMHARRLLVAQGVDVVDAVRAERSRWWSLLCQNPQCCPPQGNPYDVDTSAVAAEAVLAGLQRAPDRDALHAQVAPGNEECREAVARAARRTRSTPLDLTQFLTSFLDRPARLDTESTAALAQAVQSKPARDEAWAMMTRSTATQHFELWRTVMQAVPDELLAPVGSLAAFAAWLSGNGVLASHAADRVLAVDPTYTMARLVVTALNHCIHPDTWQPGRLGELQLLKGGGGAE